jgi:hypothetical protein
MQLTLDLTFESVPAAAGQVEVPALGALPNEAAAVLGEIVRAYRAAHRLGGTGEADLGDWNDDPAASGVCGVHPH